MGDEGQIVQLKGEIKHLKERLTALERELRLVREDILSGDAKARMQKRLLEKPRNKKEEMKKKIDNIKIEI